MKQMVMTKKFKQMKHSYPKNIKTTYKSKSLKIQELKYQTNKHKDLRKLWKILAMFINIDQILTKNHNNKQKQKIIY